MLDLKCCVPESEYGDALAQPLTLSLCPGDLLLLRGINGSGKSCHIKAISGFMRHQGSVIYDGLKLPLQFRHKHIYCPSIGLNVFAQHSLKLLLDYIADVYGVPVPMLPSALSCASQVMVGHLSQGQLQLLQLVLMVMAKKDIWVLDEVDVHLDASGHEYFNSICSSFLDTGGIVVFASHSKHDALATHTITLQRINDVSA